MTPAESDILIVSKSSPQHYNTVQSAVDAASHADEIVIIDSSTYEEQVVIIPHGAGSPQNIFHLTIRAGGVSGERPRIQYNSPEPSVPDYEALFIATIRIINRDENTGVGLCKDMRVTMQNLEIVGRGDYTCAISIRDDDDDREHLYNTGLFLHDNYIFSEPSEHQYATIYLGYRYVEGRRYDLTSLKWGEIINNTIIAGGVDMDAISTWHFTGIIANNRITSTQEGTHLSYAVIQEGKEPPFMTEAMLLDYRTTTVEHNLFVCNNQNGLHFTHGSVGIVRNNLFVKSWREDEDEGDSSIGLHVGPGCPEPGGGSPIDSTECYDDNLSDYLGQTDVTVHNNVMDWNQGPGIMIHYDNTDTEMHSNIVSRSCSIFDQDPNEIGYCAGNQARDTQYPPRKPLTYSSKNNILWNNKDKNGDYVDYLPDNPPDQTMEGDEDQNHDTGDNLPHYIGILTDQSYSYMLQHDVTETGECYLKTDVKSDAIDRGREGPDYFDVRPPGLGFPRCDAGAYGGPYAAWGGALEPCLEYTGLPPFTICE